MRERQKRKETLKLIEKLYKECRLAKNGLYIFWSISLTYF